MTQCAGQMLRSRLTPNVQVLPTLQGLASYSMKGTKADTHSLEQAGHYGKGQAIAFAALAFKVSVFGMRSLEVIHGSKF